MTSWIEVAPILFHSVASISKWPCLLVKARVAERASLHLSTSVDLYVHLDGVGMFSIAIFCLGCSCQCGRIDGSAGRWYVYIIEGCMLLSVSMSCKRDWSCKFLRSHCQLLSRSLLPFLHEGHFVGFIYQTISSSLSSCHANRVCMFSFLFVIKISSIVELYGRQRFLCHDNFQLCGASEIEFNHYVRL